MARFLFFFSYVLPHPIDHKFQTTSLQSLSLHSIFSSSMNQAPLLLPVGSSMIVSMHTSITFEVYQRHVPYLHHCKCKSLLHVNLPRHRTTHRTPRAAFPVEVKLHKRPSTRHVCSCFASYRFNDCDAFLQLSEMLGYSPRSSMMTSSFLPL